MLSLHTSYKERLIADTEIRLAGNKERKSLYHNRTVGKSEEFNCCLCLCTASKRQAERDQRTCFP
jgi:hypothetical protein